MRLIVAALLTSAPAFATGDTGQVTVIHGIPDVDVDVYVDGDLILEDFAFGAIADPLILPADTYEIEIYAASQGLHEGGHWDPILTATLQVAAGDNTSVIAHLDADAAPTVTAYANDVGEIAEGDARLVVRHAAAAPAVDIVADGSLKLFEGVANLGEGQLDVAAGTCAVTLNAAGTGTVAFDAGDLNLAAAQSTIVYAVGDLVGGTFALLVQTIDLPVTPPPAAGNSQLTVVHGIPGATVDVFVDGAAVLTDFAPGTVTDPIDLAPGTYQVDIHAAKSQWHGGTNPLLSAALEMPPGGNVTAVAHLTEAGELELSAFLNDTTTPAAGEARLVVRHLAAAPAVDIIADGSLKLFENVTNLIEGQVDVAAGTYGVTINAAGTSNVVFDAGDVTLPEGQSTIVYAIGDLDGGTFGLLTQSIQLPAATATGTATVVHGVPGLTVDVYLNGNLALPGFAPGTVLGPLELAATDYGVAIYPAGADPLATAPAISGSTSLPAGADVSIVAHLGAADSATWHDYSAWTPTLSVFVNDVSEIAAGEARLVVRHLAAAPAVDIIADGSLKLFENVTNLIEGQVDVAAGTYGVTINAAGTSNVVFDAGDVTLPEGQSTIVYAIGDLDGGTFGLLTQAITDLGAPLVAQDWFTDDDGSVHEANINLIASLGITKGTGDGTFGPEESVTRGQMAAFLRRALALPSTTIDSFSDDEGSIFEADINAIAATSITVGTGNGTFSPDDYVTRGQMAAFLQRAFEIAPSDVDAFSDDDNSIFERNINAIAAAEVTVGTGPGTFSPEDEVTRSQMATFLARALGIGS